MKRIRLIDVDDLFSAISDTEQLIVPSDDDSGQAKFVPWKKGVSLSGKLNTVRSAKDIFFPQVENMEGFSLNGKQIEKFETRDVLSPFVIFGVRACDCHSFKILDNVFLSDPCDTFYKARRDAGTIITLACTEPSETCFCKNFDIDPAKPEGDISCWKDDTYLYWEPNTEKGKTLTSSLDILEDCDDKKVKDQQEDIRNKIDKLPLSHLDLSQFGPGKTKSLFDRKEWDDLSSACIGCGTCTFVCPTCQCFDIEDFKDGNKVRRYRCWDSCMYSDFTIMSAGQPRPTQKERFRQRFMHKLVYYPDNNNGIFSCVGCGRCLQKCPIHMNIVKVIKTIGKEEKDDK